MFLCVQCHRHVREAPCPFCGCVEAGAPVAGPRAVRIGMKRSAVLVAAAAVASLGATPGCGGATAWEPLADSGAAEAGPDVAVTAPGTAYGVPVIMDSGAPTADADGPDARDASKDAIDEPVTAPGTDYGMPPPPPDDAGH